MAGQDRPGRPSATVPDVELPAGPAKPSARPVVPGPDRSVSAAGRPVSSGREHRDSQAASLETAMSLIEHEWVTGTSSGGGWQAEPMRFGLSYSTGSFGTAPERLTAAAQLAEECGFESFYLPEHMALHLGARVGDFEIPPATPIADPLECLAFVAASTSRILLGTGVLLLPYHQPVVLAKRLATLDVLSAGRMRLLTIGVGALPGEAAAVGVDYATRGHRADEAMDVLRALWAGDEQGVSFAGRFFSFTDVTSFPKPLGVRTLPIHVGGSSRAAARRAGLRGDGWFPGGWLPPDERLAQWELVRSTAVEAGRDPDRLEHTRWASLELEPSGVDAYAAQGVTRLVVGLSSTDLDEQRRDLEAFATRNALR